MDIESGVTLEAGQFVTFTPLEVKPLGIVAKKTRGRWQYRDIDSKHLYASGMDPAAFVKKFWFRDDYVEPVA